jgi:hypothetical protein
VKGGWVALPAEFITNGIIIKEKLSSQAGRWKRIRSIA